MNDIFKWDFSALFYEFIALLGVEGLGELQLIVHVGNVI